MNERIKQLAEHLSPVATIGNWGRVEWADNIYPQLGDKMYAYIDLEKFTELIVRECVQVSGPEDSYTDEWFKAKADSVAKIKQHFGVEE